MNRRRTGLALVTTLAALSLVACGSDTSTTGTAPTTAPAPTTATTAASGATDDLAAQVPDAIKSDGKLKIGTDASYPPNEYVDTDGKTIVGWDVDLGTAIAKKLGLEPEFENANFDTIIPGISSGKYELGVSSFTDNLEREKVVDFVDYYSAGTAWAAQKGNPKNVDPNNACGLKVGVQRGTVQVDDITTKSKACTDAGKPAIEQVVRTQQTEVNADLVSGKTDAMAADSPIVGYAVKQTGNKIEIVGQVYDTAPYGFAVKKGSEMTALVQKAVAALMADGTYKSIMDEWGVGDGAVTEAKVNGAQG
jgi:polar amino acid transport system substrate-binding protein